MKKSLPNKELRKQYQQPKKQVKKNKYSDLIGLGIIILLGILIYSNSFNCSFHFDDLLDIVNNPKIRNLADVKAWWNYVSTRPIGFFTFTLNYHFNQLDVRYYHLVNLVIHLSNACLVWWLTFLLLSSPALTDHPVTRQKKVIAFFTALLFVSHPLATQSVTYIVQRLAALVSMFYFLSLALYIKGRLTNKRFVSKYLLFTGSFISALLATLTKENAFTLPFAIVLIELFFLRTKRISINFKDYRIILLLAALLSVMIIIPLKFSFSIFKPIPPTQGNTYTITSFNYLLTQFSVILKYIQLLLLPIKQNLDYDFPISHNFFGLRTFVSFLVLLSLFFLAIFLFKKQKLLSFGILWFFLTLSVESSIIPIPNVIFEHRTYLPSFGFFLILCSGIFILSGIRYKYIAISVLTILIGFNSALTYERNKVWKDDFSLWNDVVFKSPNKVRPICNRGVACFDLGQWEAAIADYSRGIAINPRYPGLFHNRAKVLTKKKQFQLAINDYTAALFVDSTLKFPPSSSINSLEGRAYLFLELRQTKNAINDYTRLIRLRPENDDYFLKRGYARYLQKDYAEALIDFDQCLLLNPKNPAAYYDIATIHFENKDYSKAFNYVMKAKSLGYAVDKSVEDFLKSKNSGE